MLSVYRTGPCTGRLVQGMPRREDGAGRAVAGPGYKPGIRQRSEYAGSCTLQGSQGCDTLHEDRGHCFMCQSLDQVGEGVRERGERLRDHAHEVQVLV